MLDSDDEKTQLVAARSLFSYGTTTPPGEDRANVPYPAPSLEPDYTKILDEAGRRVCGARCVAGEPM